MEYIGTRDFSLNGIYTALLRKAKQQQRTELVKLYGNDWRKHETNVIDPNIAYYESKALEIYELIGE